MRVGRRSFLLGAAATACVGCGDGDEVSTASTTSTTSTTSRDSASEDTTEDTDASTGFGSVVALGTVDEVLADITENDGFLYVPEARSWIVAYPGEHLDAARDAYDADTSGGLERGLLALYQKCPHLGCRVPVCASSQRFECQCHGSVYNLAGEWLDGPAPRGMDRFPLRFDGDDVAVDTTAPLPGLDRGITTFDDDPPGPSCIGA